MKKTILILLTVIIYASCSSNDDNQVNNNQNIEVQFLTTIRSDDFHDQFDYDSDTLVYENNRLTKALFFQCSGALYQFKYNSNGKVSLFYRAQGMNTSDLNTDFSTSNTVSRTEFTYDANQRLERLENFRPNISTGIYELEHSEVFEYDSQNRIYRITYTDDFTTDVGLVSQFDSNGNMISDEDGYIFEYDNSQNPFYVLFQEFGIRNIESCSLLEVQYQYHLSPNNLKRVTNSSGNVEFLTSYNVNSQNYPVSSNVNSTVETYLYIQ